MISVAQCAAFAGLASNELVLGVTPSARHHWLLSSYLLNLGRGPQAVREMIVADLRAFLDLGARQRAADLLIVLRFFLSDHPEAKCVSREREQDDTFVPSDALCRNEAGTRSRGADGGRISNKEARREISPNSHARVEPAEEDGDEKEGGVVYLLPRRHPKRDGARRPDRLGVGDRVRNARASVESGGRLSSEEQDNSEIDGHRGRWRFRLLTNKDAN